MSTIPMNATPNSLEPAAARGALGRFDGHLSDLRYLGHGPAYTKPGGRVRYRLADVLAHEEASRVEPGKAEQQAPRGPGVFR